MTLITNTTSYSTASAQHFLLFPCNLLVLIKLLCRVKQNKKKPLDLLERNKEVIFRLKLIPFQNYQTTTTTTTKKKKSSVETIAYLKKKPFFMCIYKVEK